MEDQLFNRYAERAESTEQLAHEQLFVQAAIDDVEEAEDLSGVCWKNLLTDDKRCKILTGFTSNEFITIFEQCESGMKTNTGRGKRAQVSKEDKLVILLCYLKHYKTVDKLSETFTLSKSYTHNILQETINEVADLLYRIYVENVIPDLAMRAMFPGARFVLDATLQPIWTPVGTYDERRRYFSGKHKCYGIKTQCLLDRSGLLVYCKSGVPGSVHDLTIARHTLQELRSYLHSDINEDDCSLLADLGYVGLNTLLRANIPYKRPPGGQLQAEQRAYNTTHASQRVICERYYGGLKSKWRIMSGKWRNDREDYSIIFKLCSALTNADLNWHPL